MEGKCLCGKVVIKAKDVAEFEACHCGMCRRWGGGPLMAFHCGHDVEIEGKDLVKVFKSSDWAERAFCDSCGTHMYYRFVPANEFIVPIGLFQDREDYTFAEQIFIDSKPNFYSFENETIKLTEQQVIEKYSQ